MYKDKSKQKEAGRERSRRYREAQKALQGVTEDIGKGVTPEGVTAQGVTLQSRGDTCVPAACATALRQMGIATTEGEMCHVVMARPGRGSTLARAAYGLRRHLARRGIDVLLENLDADEVMWTARPTRPVLVVIRSSLAADHMVVVMGRLGDGVVIANPSPGAHGGVSPMPLKLNMGFEMYRPEDFARLYRGGAIVFEAQQAQGGGP